jgi:hypothetical protein
MSAEKADDEGFAPDAALRRAAEAEMRRVLPDHAERPHKRARAGEQEEYTEIGRFDYSSVHDLAEGVQGFLVTCNFRRCVAVVLASPACVSACSTRLTARPRCSCREKSATREAGALIHAHLQLPGQPRPGAAAPPAAAAAQAAAPEAPPAGESTQEPDLSGSTDAGAAPLPQPGGGPPAAPAPVVSLVKLDARGVVLFRLAPRAGASPAELGAAVEAAALRVLRDVETGAAPRLQHAQRLLPLHATCALDAAALRAAAARAAALAAPALAAAGRPSFAIGYKSRAGDGPGGGAGVMDRGAVIAAVAEGFQAALKEAHPSLRVDLGAPSVVVCVEVLPVMGRLYAGLAALPAAACSVKPHLGMRGVGAGAAQAQGGGGGKANINMQRGGGKTA